MDNSENPTATLGQSFLAAGLPQVTIPAADLLFPATRQANRVETRSRYLPSVQNSRNRPVSPHAIFLDQHTLDLN